MFANLWNTVKTWWAKPFTTQQPNEPAPASTMPVVAVGDKPVVTDEKRQVVETKSEVVEAVAPPVKSVPEPQPAPVNTSLSETPVVIAMEAVPTPVSQVLAEKAKKAKAAKKPQEAKVAKPATATAKKSRKGKSATT